jgi:hypothetical protein
MKQTVQKPRRAELRIEGEFGPYRVTILMTVLKFWRLKCLAFWSFAAAKVEENIVQCVSAFIV